MRGTPLFMRDAGKVWTMNPTKVQTIPVSGMTCASCVLRVEKALKSVDGVSDAAVNLATERVRVSYDPARTTLAGLEAAVERAGYTLRIGMDAGTDAKHAGGSDEKTLRRDLLVGILFGLPVAFLGITSMSKTSGGLLPLSDEAIAWISFGAATVVVAFSGRRFFAGAWKLARIGTADMNSLVAAGVGSAYVLSAASVLFPSPAVGLAGGMHPLYFDSAATIVILVLFGRWLESRARRSAATSIRKLMEFRPGIAHLRQAEAETDVPVGDVVVGDLLSVRPGELIPVDGVIAGGSATVDESSVTGESFPVEKNATDAVTGGTMLLQGNVLMRATAVGQDTLLARIVALVEEAQSSKPPVQMLVDRVAAVFVPIVIVVAFITLLAWTVLASAPFSQAVTNFVSVLVIACPCALGLATPTAIVVGSGLGASSGILIRNADILERAHRLTTVVLDKTGTLTKGTPEVLDFSTCDANAERRFLQLAASAEQNSNHPLARSIVAYARSRSVPISAAVAFESLTGFGVKATVDGATVLVGNSRLMMDRHVTDEGGLLGRGSGEQGSPGVYVAVDGKVVATFGLADAIAPGAAEAVRELRDMNLRVVLLTGDREEAGLAVAGKVGIEEVIARVLPDGKSAVVRRFQERGECVAMVGDGINDAAALAQADVGIAIGAGADIAKESADVTLTSRGLQGVARSIRLSRATMRTIRQNLFWAFFYNVVAIPAAAFGYLSPVVAAGAMAMSSLSVVTNSLRLRWRKL